VEPLRSCRPATLETIRRGRHARRRTEVEHPSSEVRSANLLLPQQLRIRDMVLTLDESHKGPSSGLYSRCMMQSHRLSLAALLALSPMCACDNPTQPAADATATVRPAPPLPSFQPAPLVSSCTPGFTPYNPARGHCSAHHTVCSPSDGGVSRCHGGAIIIECGQCGERCGKSFCCECPDSVPASSAK